MVRRPSIRAPRNEGTAAREGVNNKETVSREHSVERTRVQIDYTESFTNPCTNEPIIATIESQGHLIHVFDGGGGEHVNLFAEGHGYAESLDGSTTYVVGQTLVGSGNATFEQDTEVVTVVTNIHLVSPDGTENYIGHGIVHLTFRPDGATSDVEFISLECRG